jgi:hypothetical protein
MYASLENHAHGEKRPCVCHPDFLYIYFVDTTLAIRSPEGVLKNSTPSVKRSYKAGGRLLANRRTSFPIIGWQGV